MNPDDWQSVAAAAIVLLTLGIFLYRLVRGRAKRAGPCGCSGCGVPGTQTQVGRSRSKGGMGMT
ncbi:MAG: hypothetical protein RLZZ179_944 [Verrucomicrobiota bacterium]|jgi:hypothetical protein